MKRLVAALVLLSSLFVFTTSSFAGETAKIGPVRRAIGNAFKRSAEKGLAKSERMISKGQMWETHPFAPIRKMGSTLAWFGAVKGVRAVLKGEIAAMLLHEKDLLGKQQ